MDQGLGGVVGFRTKAQKYIINKEENEKSIIKKKSIPSKDFENFKVFCPYTTRKCWQSIAKLMLSTCRCVGDTPREC